MEEEWKEGSREGMEEGKRREKGWQKEEIKIEEERQREKDNEWSRAIRDRKKLWKKDKKTRQDRKEEVGGKRSLKWWVESIVDSRERNIKRSQLKYLSDIRFMDELTGG